MHPFLTIADQAARKAGQLLIRTLDYLDTRQIKAKQAHSPISEISYKIAKILAENISEAYPHHAILIEGKSHLSGNSEYCWIIDPLNGVNNFIHGLPGFAIAIALQYKNRLEQALIYDPLAQESFYATRGQGARLHQKRLRVSDYHDLETALLYMEQPPKEPQQLTAYLQRITILSAQGFGMRHLGSTALGLAYVAAGRLEGFFSTTLKSWQIAAGALLVQEAGGIVCDEKGGEAYLKNGTLIAANPKLCQNICKLLNISI
jgi:myo-inositol-1(or 4)-monophosphatase